MFSQRVGCTQAISTSRKPSHPFEHIEKFTPAQVEQHHRAEYGFWTSSGRLEDVETAVIVYIPGRDGVGFSLIVYFARGRISKTSLTIVEEEGVEARINGDKLPYCHIEVEIAVVVVVAEGDATHDEPAAADSGFGPVFEESLGLERDGQDQADAATGAVESERAVVAHCVSSVLLASNCKHSFK